MYLVKYTQFSIISDIFLTFRINYVIEIEDLKRDIPLYEIASMAHLHFYLYDVLSEEPLEESLEKYPEINIDALD